MRRVAPVLVDSATRWCESRAWVDGRGMIGEQIAEAAQGDPRGAFDLLSALLPSGEDARQPYDLLENAPTVIAAALDQDDPDLRGRAEDLLNELGKAGNLEMHQSVTALRRRSLARQFTGSPTSRHPLPFRHAEGCPNRIVLGVVIEISHPLAS